MKRYFHSSTTALALSAMVMSSMVVATVSLSAAPAFSKSDNANSNSNSGRGNDNRGGNANSNSGATTSSLGALNAAHANANALANAAENSRVGMIELYKLAVMARAEARSNLEWFEINCAVPVEDAIAEQCEALLLAASANADEPLDYEDYLEILRAEVLSLGELEEDALELAANNKTDDDVIEALWELLEPEDSDPTE